MVTLYGPPIEMQNATFSTVGWKRASGSERGHFITKTCPVRITARFIIVKNFSFYFPSAISKCLQYRIKVFSFAFIVEIINYLQQRQNFNRTGTQARRRRANQEVNAGTARAFIPDKLKITNRENFPENVLIFFLFLISQRGYHPARLKQRRTRLRA